MLTKTVSSRGPPLVPYNKVHLIRFISKSKLHEMVIICVTICCFCIQLTSTTVGTSSAGDRTDIPRYTEPSQVNVKLIEVIFLSRGTFKIRCLKNRIYLDPIYELAKLKI